MTFPKTRGKRGDPEGPPGLPLLFSPPSELGLVPRAGGPAQAPPRSAGAEREGQRQEAACAATPSLKKGNLHPRRRRNKARGSSRATQEGPGSPGTPGFLFFLPALRPGTPSQRGRRAPGRKSGGPVPAAVGFTGEEFISLLFTQSTVGLKTLPRLPRRRRSPSPGRSPSPPAPFLGPSRPQTTSERGRTRPRGKEA